MRIRHLFEAYHDYSKTSADHDYIPAKLGDVFRVFHGFRSLDEAVHVARRGLSGKSWASRVYSYEANNNPFGLFVTVNFDTAKEFVGTSYDRAILEFNATYEDLESPVWPGGGYTVQGQMSQYFSGDPGTPTHRRSRIQAMRQRDSDVIDNKYTPNFVKQSHSPYKASVLMASGEQQALFIGDLSPNDIAGIWVQENDGIDSRWSENPWIKMSVKQFLEKYDTEDVKEDDHRMKAFLPTDVFTPEAFFANIYNGITRETFDRVCKMWAKDIRRSSNKKYTFLETVGKYLWPKQYASAFRWLMRTYKSDK